MEITATLVKELRERTGAGMMECKKALVETGGDIDAAVDTMRKAGLAKADKKAGRIAAEGRIAIAVDPDRHRGAMVEVNCETDFVAKQEEFEAFAAAVARRALEADVDEVAALLETTLDESGGTVDLRRRELVARTGENITVRRVAGLECSDGIVGSYLHGGRIGVLVAMRGGDEELAKDIAMHVAASRPVCVSEEDVPGEMVAKEREIFEAQAASSGKPPEIVDRMVSGRLKKFLREVTLLGQPFVKDPDIAVEKHLAGRGATVSAFRRLEVGEGIEKRSGNFAEEVMAQVRGS